MPTGALAQPAWMRFAWAEFGQREIAGPASNPRIAGYIRRVGHPEAASDDTAWCSAFVGACLDRAGIPGTGSLMARSYYAWGVPAPASSLGAIAILSRGSDPASGHVGFLVGMTDDAVFLLGGNQSDAVSVARFDRGRLLGLRLPGTDEIAVPAGSDQAVPAPASPAGSDETQRFAWSLARVLDFEGGYTDDPFDPGGPTNKGITLADYARAVGEVVLADSVGRLKAGLRAIPDDLLERIYRERYWQPASCARLPRALSHLHFDCAVNQGVGGAIRMLQKALDVDVDGEIGPLTLAAAEARPIAASLERYAAIRRQRYRQLHHFWRFGRGWLARVDKALAQSRSLLAGTSTTDIPEAPPATSPTIKPTGTKPSPPTPPETPQGSQPMSSNAPSAPVPPEGKWWGQSLTIWGALLTAATTVAPAVFAAFGLDVSADLAARLGQDAVAVAQAMAGLAGTVMTIAGRARAATPLQRRAISLHV